MVGESLLIKLAEKVVDKIFEKAAGKPVSKLLEDIEKKNAFKKAIAECFQSLVKRGFKVGRSGTLYKEFFLDEDVFGELWLKVVDPVSVEEINFDLLEKKFKECWQAHVDIDKKAEEGIRYFCNTLESAVFHQSELRDLLNTKTLRELRDWISFDEIERLKKKCLEHIRTTKEKEFQEELGEGNDYVEPAIERKTERPLWEKMPLELKDKKKKIGEETYFAPISLAEIVRQDKNDYVLVSESGMGKTTFLKWLELSLSKGEVSKYYLPVYLHLSILRDYTTQDQLISRLATKFSRVTDKRKLERFISAVLKQKKFLFLLDGLDQVSDSSIVSQQLQSKEIFGDNKIILATRQIGYSLIASQLRNYKFIQLIPFNQKRIEKYLKDRTENPKVKEIIRQNRELVRIPILLQMISSLLAEDGETLSEIRTRSHLYERFIDHLFEHEKEVKTTRLSAEKRKLDLQKLSYDLIDRGFLGSFPEKVVYKHEVLEEDELYTLLDWGILNRIFERTTNQIDFRHQSFQEYFASLELKDNIFSGDGKLIEEEFRRHLEHRKWDQSFLFLVGLLDQRCSKDLIWKITEYDLFFSGLCISYCASDPQKFANLIEELLDSAEKGFYRTFDILSKIGDERIVDRLLQWLSESEDEIIRREAAYALGEIGDSRAIDGLANALGDQESWVRANAAEALGRIRDSRAIHPLAKALMDVAIGPTAGEALKEIGDPSVTMAFMQCLGHRDKEIQIDAARVLGFIGDPSSIPSLANLLGHREAEMRWAAVNALSLIGHPETIDPLLEALTDDDVGWDAAYALAAIGDSKAVPRLIETLTHKHRGIRQRAACALGGITDPRAVRALVGALADVDPGVRLLAAEGLGKIGDLNAVVPLIAALEDEDEAVRSSAAEALGKIGDSKATDSLINALTDGDEHVRSSAAEALGEIGGAIAVDPLIGVLNHEDAYTRWSAAQALGEVGNSKAVDALLRALKDRDRTVRQTAADALGKIGDPKGVDSLVGALEEEVEWVRSYAAEALGRIADPKAVAPLIKALRDNHDWVRRAAAESLGRIGSRRAIDPLMRCLKDQDRSVRAIAAKALVEIIGYKELILKLRGSWQALLSENKQIIEGLFHKQPRRLLDLGLKYWKW